MCRARSVTDGHFFPQLLERYFHEINHLLDEKELVESAVSGALQTFACFGRIFESLELNKTRIPHASAINPEAGDHPVVSDEVFRLVATRAGTQCHSAFGYLVRRYGDRGENFARSDGAWLGTLTELPEDEARRQIDWLARLLSARGIPSVCLEYHLDELHRNLQAHKAHGANNLLFESLARYVASGYRLALSTESYAQLANAVIPALEPRGADVLLCAVVDQHAGLAPCADRIADWIGSELSFDEATRRDLLTFLSKAHAVIAS